MLYASSCIGLFVLLCFFGLFPVGVLHDKIQQISQCFFDYNVDNMVIDFMEILACIMSTVVMSHLSILLETQICLLWLVRQLICN